MRLFYLLFSLLVSTIFAATAAVPDTSNENQVKKQLNNYLWDAAREGNSKVIDSFISARYNLNMQDERGYTAVILATYHGHTAVVEALLNAGADPCIQDKRGNSALMGAIFKGELKIAQRLISAKCNPDARNNSGQTAAMYASLFQRHDLLAELKAKGADMQAKDINGNNVEALDKGEINGNLGR